eukprot:2678361-Pyramimonas_sp.AAC.1
MAGRGGGGGGGGARYNNAEQSDEERGHSPAGWTNQTSREEDGFGSGGVRYIGDENAMARGGGMSGHQSQKGRENIPVAGTNHGMSKL